MRIAATENESPVKRGRVRRDRHGLVVESHVASLLTGFHEEPVSHLGDVVLAAVVLPGRTGQIPAMNDKIASERSTVSMGGNDMPAEVVVAMRDFTSIVGVPPGRYAATQ